MAQTSFDMSRTAMSDALVATLARATEYAVGQSHGTVSLEHLLLSLTEDADAAHVLEASSVDLTRLRNDVASFIGQQLPNARGGQPELDPDLSKILTYAEAAARQSGRSEINGAIVLAAIVGEGRSMAATFLKAQGLTFQAAIRAIKQALAPTPPASAAENAPDATSPTGSVGPPPSMMPRERARPSDSSTESGHAPLPEPQRAQREILGIPSIRPAPTPRVEPVRRASEPVPQPAGTRTHDRHGDAPTESERPDPRQDVPEARNEPRHEPAQIEPVLPPIADPPPPARQPEPARPAPPSAAPAPRPPPVVGPPPLPSRDAGRRVPESQPPMPPPLPPAPGLGSARPPPPRPSLRLPPSQPEEPPIIAPWPAETNDLRTPPPPPPPQRRGMTYGTPPAPELEHRAARSGRPAPPRERPAIDKGQLVENIPRKMKVGVIETFEVRIDREGIEAGRGLGGRGAPQHHAILITRAMSVRLQSEPGRFYIEASSPETQWTGARGDQLASDYAVWRFTVIPQRRGQADLTLVVSARTIGADGVVADTSLPEQRITIRVSANVTRGLKRWLGWIAVAVLGGVVAKVGENFWDQALSFLRQALAM